MGPLGFCRLEVGYSRTGKSVYFFVVGAFLLRVPCTFFFFCGCAARFFLLRVPGAFLLRVRGALFDCCGCAASSLTHLLPAASEHPLQKDNQGPGCFFLMRVRELTDSRAARRSEHPQQKKAPTAKKKNTGSQPHHTTVPMS